MKAKIGIGILMAACLAATSAAFVGGREGWGVARPVKNPESIREGSARAITGPGHHRTRYFIGGGLRGGK